jgi:hypothetical protein
MLFVVDFYEKARCQQVGTGSFARQFNANCCTVLGLMKDGVTPEHPNGSAVASPREISRGTKRRMMRPGLPLSRTALHLHFIAWIGLRVRKKKAFVSWAKDTLLVNASFFYYLAFTFR